MGTCVVVGLIFSCYMYTNGEREREREREGRRRRGRIADISNIQ